MAVSFSQRKALGRRYAIDPAYMLASEELAQKYALQPKYDALALDKERLEESKRQANLADQRTQEQIAAQSKAGMVGTAGNLVTGVPMTYYAGKAAGLWGTGAGTASSVTPAAYSGVSSGAAGAGAGFSANPALTEYSASLGTTNTVTPALIDSGAPVATEGAAAGTSAATSGGATIGGAASVLGYVAAAAMARKKWGELDKPYADRGALGKFTSAPVTGGVPALMETAGVNSSNYFAKGPNELARGEENLVGKPLDAFFSGDVGGGLNAMVQGIKSTPRSLWNSTVGSITGGLLGTWICTAVHKAVGIDKEDQTALFNLRKYSLRNHPGWLHWYLDEGQKIVDGIEKATSPGDLQSMYESLKTVFVLPITALVKGGDMEGAYNYYLNFSRSLCRIYAPDVEIKEHGEVV